MKSNLNRSHGLGALVGAGVGAGTMYYLDPARGARRRSMVRDQAVHVIHKAGDQLDKASRDIAHRSKGIWSRAKQRVGGVEDVSDEVLVQRVRARLGRHVSHPHSIEVSAENGRINLKGLILSHEVDGLLSAVSKIPGVRGVENRLQPHTADENVPSLQGGNPRTGERPDFLQTNWAPGTRLILGMLGIGAVYYGFFKRWNALGLGVGVFGGGILARAIFNLETKRLIGVGGKGAITVHKTININAPVDQVFDFWSHFENFPKFMRDVKEVRTYEGGRSRWTVTGPARTPVSWEAELTHAIQNELIEWQSIPSAMIQNSGRVRFSPNEQGGTRIDIDFCYEPVAGALGHLIAMIFGSSPKSRLDDALLRMKSLIEQGPSERQLRSLVSSG